VTPNREPKMTFVSLVLLFVSSDIGGATVTEVPPVDQQLALSLLIELATQRGSLSHLLDAVLLLLHLRDKGQTVVDNRYFKCDAVLTYLDVIS
jgi:hypothetical protein